MLCLQEVEVRVWIWTLPGVGQLGGMDSSAEGHARGDIASAGPAHVSAHGEVHQKRRARLGVGGCLSSHSGQDQVAHKGLRSPVFGQQIDSCLPLTRPVWEKAVCSSLCRQDRWCLTSWRFLPVLLILASPPFGLCSGFNSSMCHPQGSGTMCVEGSLPARVSHSGFHIV